MKRLVYGLILLVIAAMIITGCAKPVTTTEPIKIGALLPLTGPNAVYGVEIKNAMELAREEINLKGGINGRNLDIIYEDDQANPSVGTNAMQKLVTIDEVPVVMGSWSSGVVVATAPIAESNEVIIMALAISPAITNAGDYIFRMQPSAIFYTEKSVVLLKSKGMSDVAIIYANNEFGVALKDSFQKSCDDVGLIIVDSESYNSGDTDFKTQLSKIKEKNPELVFIAGYQDTIQVIKQMKELGMTQLILAGPPFESQSTIEKLGVMAEGVIYPYHFVSGTENNNSKIYEQKYLEKYSFPTGGFAPLMYDATYIVANTLKECEQNTNCIKAELYKTRYSGVVGEVTFDQNGDPNIPIVMKTVKDGQFVRYE